jgi:hypothetical protein
MKKILPLLLIAAIPSAIAEGYMMQGYGMMGYGGSLVGVIYFVLLAFVFSIIFWGTHNWLCCKKKK